MYCFLFLYWQEKATKKKAKKEKKPEASHYKAKPDGIEDEVPKKSKAELKAERRALQVNTYNL